MVMVTMRQLNNNAYDFSDDDEEEMNLHMYEVIFSLEQMSAFRLVCSVAQRPGLEFPLFEQCDDDDDDVDCRSKCKIMNKGIICVI